MINSEQKPEQKEESWFKAVPFLTIITGIYIIVFYLKMGIRIPFLGEIRLEFIIGSFLVAMAIFFSLARENKVSSKNLVTLTVLFILICGVYTIFSYDRDTSIFVFNNHVLKFSALALFITAFCRTSISLKFFIACLFLAWLKLGQEGFMGWITGSMMWENQGIPRLHGSVGEYGHPNSFSGFAVGTLPFILYLYPVLKKRWQKLALLVMLVFAAIIIVATGSRTGYVATVLFLIYYMFGLKINKLKAILLLLIAAGIGVMAIPESYKERFETIFTLQEAQGKSSAKRIEIIKDAWHIYTRYPLGIGVDAFPAVRLQMFGRFQNTHNLYLQILTNIGPIGFLVFFLLTRKIILLNKHNIRKNTEFIDDIDKTIVANAPEEVEATKEIEDRQFLIALSRAIIGFIVVRLLLGFFGMDLYEIYWWLAIGLTLSVNIITNQSDLSENNQLYNPVLNE